jgi:hypothetical protein
MNILAVQRGNASSPQMLPALLFRCIPRRESARYVRFVSLDERSAFPERHLHQQ